MVKSRKISKKARNLLIMHFKHFVFHHIY